MNQNTTLAINAAGLAPGLSRATWGPAGPECSALSTPTFSSALVRIPFTRRAMKYPTTKMMRKPSRLGRNPNKPSSAR